MSMPWTRARGSRASSAGRGGGLVASIEAYAELVIEEHMRHACHIITHENLRIAPLADHPEMIPTLTEWFETEWPSY
jgi:hypothetical protein